ncbi:conserved hypothetical protein [Neospora caninum Liverpool]|uniref:Uncharacterized protein n=1 Tax=Neospora caninum (strain Liverpool) TaxID=572307 RepID=F0VBJ9_NEOCL|nr:conserved hypothetical protein [Neospora caninum Liverpool]CBZ50983.1 conserved hypothetical protein [Neospora caninum Liverpool]|eukprot:XP_003881016.1 conserved hypothetical protein [Neospora caninum Liverpool]
MLRPREIAESKSLSRLLIKINRSASSSASTPSTTLSSPASSASSSASSVSPSSPSSLSSPHSAAASSLSLNADVVRDKEAPHAGQAERGPPRSEGETSEPAATGLAGEGSEPDSNGAEDGRDQATDGTDTSSPAGEPPVEHGENKHGENKKQAEKENVAMGGESETEVASAGSVRSKDEEHTRTREAGLRRKPHVSRVEQAVPKCQTHAEHAQEEVVGAVGIVQTGLGARIVQHLPLMAALLGLPCLIFKRESTALCDILGLPSVAAFAVRAPRDSRRSQLSLSSPSCSSSSALPADSPAMAACPSPRPDACAAPSLKASLAAFLSLSASLVYPTSFPFFLPRLHPPGVPAAAPRLPRGRGARRPEGPSDECVFSPASSGLDGAETKTEETRHAVETLGTRNDVDEDGKGEEDGRQDGREDLGKGLPAAGTFRSGPGVSAACARRLRIETRGWQPFLGTCLATSFCDARDAEAGNKKTRRETRRLKRRERRRLLFKKAKARKEEKKPKAGQEKE